MSEELKPCPFCGKNAGSILTGNAIPECDEDIDVKHATIICNGCEASSGIYDTYEDAVAAWNRRAALNEEKENK